MGKIKAVIFDLDGVITDTAKFQYLTWKEIGKDLGIEITEEFNDEIKGVSRMDSLDGVLKFGGKEKEFSKKEKEELCDEKNDKYQKYIDKIKPKDVFPGIKEIMKGIKEAGLKIAVGSSSSNAPKVIKNLKLEEFIDCIVDPNEVKKGKPAPDIFLKAAKILGVKPEECVVIEDSEAGVKAIERAKMFSVAVGKPDNEKDADARYKGTEDMNLKEILKKAEK